MVGITVVRANASNACRETRASTPTVVARSAADMMPPPSSGTVEAASVCMVPEVMRRG